MAMNGYGDDFSRMIQNYMVGRSNVTQPTIWYVGLGQTSVLESDGTAWVEVPSTYAYARVQVFGASSASPVRWSSCLYSSEGTPTPSPFTVSNIAAIEFPTALAPGWGSSILCAAVWAGATTVDVEELLFGGALTDPKTIGTGTTAVFLIGQCKLSCSNAA